MMAGLSEQIQPVIKFGTKHSEELAMIMFILFRKLQMVAIYLQVPPHHMELAPQMLGLSKFQVR